MTLIRGRKTAHSTFRIPIDIDVASTCSMKKCSEQADMLWEVKLIIWDELPAQHCFCAEAGDWLFQDVLSKDMPFGIMPVVLCLVGTYNRCCQLLTRVA